MPFFKNALITFCVTATVAMAGPVSQFGKLVTCGGHLCGEKTGTSIPVQVKGPSLFWSTGNPSAFYTASAVDWFVMNMDISVIRAAMAIKYWDNGSSPISVSDGASAGTVDFGYLSTATGLAANAKAKQKARIETVIQAAIDDDIYVIVDWHSHRAESEQSEAVAFFKEMATTYKDVPNIIWEVYNEPMTNAGTINTYATAVTAAIRNTGNSNLIMVGSSDWSKDPLGQSQQGLHNSYSNIAYTFHFYAASHPQSGSIGSSAQSAINNGVAVFGSEWGTTDYSGDGTPNSSATSAWTTWMDNNKVSNCNWFAGADSQTSAMFNESVTVASMSTSGLSTSGKIFQTYMSQNKWSSFVPSTNPFGNNVQVSLAEGASKTFSSELGLRGTISDVSTPATGTVSFTSSSITYQSAEDGSPETVSFIYHVMQNNITIQQRVIINIINRKPIIPDTTLSVSYKVATALSLKTRLGVIDPASGNLTIQAASVNVGTVTFTNDAITYTPNGIPGTVILTYSVSNSSGTATGTATLVCENQAPTIYTKTNMGSKENTSDVRISIANVRGKDVDGDSVHFRVYYLDPNYPGSLTISADSDTLIYTPASGYIGTVTILAVLTDGSLDSKIGTILFTLTGAGTAISVVAPTTIPNYTPAVSIPSAVAPLSNNAMAVTLRKSILQFSVSRSGFVSVDLFGLKGNKVQSLWKGNAIAGTHSIKWDATGLARGLYLVRMQQGSQIKVGRFVNR